MEMKMEDEKVKVRGIYISKIRSISGTTIESLHKIVSEILKQKELNRDGMVQFPNTSENQIILVFIEDEFSIKPFISNRPWFKVGKCQLDFHPEEIENLAVLDEILVKKLGLAQKLKSIERLNFIQNLNQFQKKHGKRDNEEKSFCKFENDSFFVKLNDGSDGSINFTDKRGKKDMVTLFAVFFDYWKSFGEKDNGWIVVKMSKGEIKKRLAEKGKKDITDNWIKDTISNIRNIKIGPSKLNGYISFDYYDRKANVYPFRIKRV